MSTSPTIFVVDPDEATRQAPRNLAGIMNLRCESYVSGENFLDAYDPSRPGCLVVEIRMPGINGLRIQQILIERRATLPVIFLCSQSTVAAAVQAMRSGALAVL